MIELLAAKVSEPVVQFCDGDGALDYASMAVPGGRSAPAAAPAADFPLPELPDEWAQLPSLPAAPAGGPAGNALPPAAGVNPFDGTSPLAAPTGGGTDVGADDGTADERTVPPGHAIFEPLDTVLDFPWSTMCVPPLVVLPAEPPSMEDCHVMVPDVANGREIRYCYQCRKLQPAPARQLC